MDTTIKDLNSCLMMAVNVDTPVNLGCIFNDSDLKNSGICIDSHITLLYAQGKTIPRENILTGLDDLDVLKEIFQEGKSYSVNDAFQLESFENDSDYVVLKMREEFFMYDILKEINRTLRRKYDIDSDFSYTPHITLAELKPGTSEKYLKSETLKLVLDNTYVYPEDIIISYGETGEQDKFVYHLTSYNSVPRYFRLERLKNYKI